MEKQPASHHDLRPKCGVTAQTRGKYENQGNSPHVPVPCLKLCYYITIAINNIYGIKAGGREGERTTGPSCLQSEGEASGDGKCRAAEG